MGLGSSDLTGSFGLTWPEAQHHFIGRSDDVVKLRGTNLYPMACLSAIKAEEGTVGERPCVVDRVGKGSLGVRDEISQEQAHRCAATHVVGKVLRLFGRNDVVPSAMKEKYGRRRFRRAR